MHVECLIRKSNKRTKFLGHVYTLTSRGSFVIFIESIPNLLLTSANYWPGRLTRLFQNVSVTTCESAHDFFFNRSW